MKNLILIVLIFLSAGALAQFPGAPVISNKKISHNTKIQSLEGSLYRLSIPLTDYQLDSSGVYPQRYVQIDSIMKYKGGNNTYIINNPSDTSAIKPLCGDMAVRTVDTCSKEVYIYRCSASPLVSTRVGWYKVGSFVNKNCVGPGSGGGGGGASTDVRWGGFTAVLDSVRLDSVSATGVVLGSKFLDNVINKTEIDKYEFTERFPTNDSLRILSVSYDEPSGLYITNTMLTRFIDNVINKKVDFIKVNDSTWVNYSTDFGNDTIISNSKKPLVINGLSLVLDTIKMGGNLNQNTTINGQNVHSLMLDSIVGIKMDNVAGTTPYKAHLNSGSPTDNYVEVKDASSTKVSRMDFNPLLWTKISATDPVATKTSSVQVQPTRAELLSPTGGISSAGDSTEMFNNVMVRMRGEQIRLKNAQIDSANGVLPAPTVVLDNTNFVWRLVDKTTGRGQWGPDITGAGANNWYLNNGTLSGDRIALGAGFNATWRNMPTLLFDSTTTFRVRTKTAVGTGDSYGMLEILGGSSELNTYNTNGSSSSNGGRIGRVRTNLLGASIQSVPSGPGSAVGSTSEFSVNEKSAVIKTTRIESTGALNYADIDFPSAGKRIRAGVIPISYNYGGAGENRDNTGGRIAFTPYRLPVTPAPDTGYIWSSKGDSMQWVPNPTGVINNWYRNDDVLTGNRIARGGTSGTVPPFPAYYDATWRKINNVTFDSISSVFKVQSTLQNNISNLFSFQTNGTSLIHNNLTTTVLSGLSISALSGGSSFLRSGKSAEFREVGTDSSGAFIKTPIRNPDGTYEFTGATIPERRVLQSAILGPSGSYGSTGGKLAYSPYGLPITSAPDSNYIMVSKGDTMVWKTLATIDSKRPITLNCLGFSENLPVAAGVWMQTTFLVPADMDGWKITGWEVSLGQSNVATGSLTFDLARYTAALNNASPTNLGKDIVVNLASGRYEPYSGSFSQTVNTGDLILVYFKSTTATGSPKGLTAKLSFVK